MNIKKLRPLLSLICVSFFGFVLSMQSSCSSSSDDRAFLKAIHASPDAPVVDILLNGAVVVPNVPYRAASGYLQVDTGVQNVKVAPAGTDTFVIDADLDLKNGIYYSVLATNNVANIAPLVLTWNGNMPPSGSSFIRVVHAAPSAPEVDVYVTVANGSIEDIEPFLRNVPFSAASDFATLSSGDYRIAVTIAGTKTVAINVPSLSVPAGGVINAVAMDAQGGGAPFEINLYSEL